MGAASVSEYVASLNEEQRRYVSAFIDFMSAEYPQVIPKISFSMPMWLLGKRCTRDIWGFPLQKAISPSIFLMRSF